MSMVSVIVPMYNVAQYVADCINSIIKQSYTDIEIICIDDGSTDDTLSIAEGLSKLDSRIIVLTQENAGLSAARNAGLCRAMGEYVLFVDSDDMLPIDALLQLIGAASKYNAQIVCSGFSYGSDFMDGIQKGVSFPKASFYQSSVEDFYFQNRITNHACAKLFSRNLFVDNGIYFPVGRSYEDVATVYLLMEAANTIASTDAPLYYYRPNSTSISHTYTLDKVFDLYSDFKEIKTHFGDSPSPSKRFYLLTVLYTTLRLLNKVAPSIQCACLRHSLYAEYDAIFKFSALNFVKNLRFSIKLLMRRFYLSRLLLEFGNR